MRMTCSLIGSMNEVVFISTEDQGMGVEKSKKRKIARNMAKK